MIDEKKTVTLDPSAKAAFAEMSTMYLRAVELLAPDGGAVRTLVLAIPIDAEGVLGEKNMTEMQMLSNMDEGDIPKILRLLAGLVEAKLGQHTVVHEDEYELVFTSDGKPN